MQKKKKNPVQNGFYVLHWPGHALRSTHFHSHSIRSVYCQMCRNSPHSRIAYCLPLTFQLEFQATAAGGCDHQTASLSTRTRGNKAMKKKSHSNSSKKEDRDREQSKQKKENKNAYFLCRFVNNRFGICLVEMGRHLGVWWVNASNVYSTWSLSLCLVYIYIYIYIKKHVVSRTPAECARQWCVAFKFHLKLWPHMALNLTGWKGNTLKSHRRRKRISILLLLNWNNGIYFGVEMVQWLIRSSVANVWSGCCLGPCVSI